LAAESGDERFRERVLGEIKKLLGYMASEVGDGAGR
jgi:hypothetical protein